MRSGAVHHVEAPGANESDLVVAHKLTREDDEVVYGDRGIENREEIKADPHLSMVEYRINRRKGAVRKRDAVIYRKPLEHGEYLRQSNWERELEYQKSKVRSKMEHVFQIIKIRFWIPEDREELAAPLYRVFASVNLLKWAWATGPGVHRRF
jgi:IS5 family transposase